MDATLPASLSLELALVLLAATIVAVPLFRRFGLVAVMAYLATGVALGPDGMGVVRDPDRILSASEIGVVMLLFVIGLELSPARLALMRRPVFGAGGAQVTASALLLGGALLLYGMHWKSALVAGLGLALSSTAVGLQLLAERRQLGSDYGRLAFSILLFQDLIAIPLLAAIPLLGGAKNQTLTWAVAAHALGALALVYFGGRLLMRRTLRVVARQTRTPEVFTATALLAVLGSAWIMQQAGLSPGLGAFIAGVLLADSEYRHELESRIEPFKGLLLGLFFIAVGMTIDLDRIAAEPWLVAGGVGLLLVAKFAVLCGVGRLARLAPGHALMLGGTLWLGGEFAFVVFHEALRVRLLSSADHDRLVAIVGVSMALMPLLMLALERLLREREARRVPSAPPPSEHPPEPALRKPQVLVAGVGRFGQIVARLLAAQGIPYVALDSSAERVEGLRRSGSRVFYGDPTRSDLLRAAGAEHVKVFVICTDDPDSNLHAVRLIRRLYPQAKILARARDRQHAWRLMDLGTEPFRELLGSSLEAGERVLLELGVPAEVAADHVHRFRRHDEALLYEQYLIHDDDAAVALRSRQARADLVRLFEADADDAQARDAATRPIQPPQ
ncbi:glutathione-regulated potassium-efflux system protein KefB [Pseudoxanthomonas broegbernensis]|uniref:Glutathione-regulated potassium-efflux system protein KefB n=1 Tax=Pseudoxanthomonas broegbernensis TaxID=83619 RepID=A0A7V8GLH2_9GAMM|nr:monovalent cation:proton antiporter-2 (CPA2) family protein [Pseudoxanthomonas broegbernensis]KAF1685725.1 glutathione-regulated potassium-efflux system protein KefB [Pseudoxanthomonas broegbernensis]MBB6066076.1 glutathione-regulated potassium-efflux system protein KefB [Pseudoxanthomonas broegbernensis]